ncbi:MAG: hypothetical protein ABSD74_17690 [Rhizomicrobium sp.]|jgi:hypothetical protein
MNWRLGLFRLWVLFSALWIAGCGVIAVTQWRESQRTVTYEVSDPQGQKYRVSAPIGTSEDDAVRFVLASPEIAKWRTNCVPPKINGPWCDFEPDVRMPGILNLWPLLAVALLVPVGMFGIAIGCFWAAAGFRAGRS